jgi:hypothetical protein
MALSPHLSLFLHDAYHRLQFLLPVCADDD